MTRNSALHMLRQQLDKHGLKDWSARITTAENSPLGVCLSSDKTIILSAYHIDIHPDNEVIDTIMHEIAHALTPGCGHGLTWMDMAKKLGANPIPCSSLYLPAHIIDAIRSGAKVESVTEETKIEVIHREQKFKVTQLRDKCPICGKIAAEKFSFDAKDGDGNDCRFITLECFHIFKKIIPKPTPFESFVSNGWKSEIKSCKHKWNKNQCTECNEFRLFNFQILGAQAIEINIASGNKGFGVFDEMGLGKTVQALAYIKYHPERLPVLYVTKSAIKFQWFKQIIRWLGEDYLPQIITTSKDYLFPGLKSYIIPYDLLRRFPEDKLKSLGIKTIILDECQQIKNADSSRTQATRKLVADEEVRVIPLSGTPWKNRGSEFFPVLNMIHPSKFWSYQAYLDNWVQFYRDGNKKKMGGIKNIPKFIEHTKNLVIRREYEEVMDEFPDINRMKLNVQLDTISQESYDESVGDFVRWYNQFVIDGTEDNISGIELLAKMAVMRHIVGIAKIPATLGYTEEFVEDTDRKLVIFIHHKDVSQLMYSALTDTNVSTNIQWHELALALRDREIEVVRYTADYDDARRWEIQENFNKYPRTIMIASTLACGEGVDLQTCSDCILHERQWNPQNEDQAAPGRFRRIGQIAKVINITVPEAEGTIDEHLDMLVERKRKQFHEVMNKGEIPTWNESDIVKELAATIVTKFNQRKQKRAS